MLRACPTLVVADKEYPTGPAVPAVQQILALFALLLLVIVQGALDFVVALGAISLDTGPSRAERPPATKIGLMVAVLVAGAAVDLLVAHTLTSALGR